MLMKASGDPHGNFSRISNKNWPEQKGMSKDDKLFFSGDFGLIYNSKRTDRYVPGNMHDPYWSNEELYWYSFLNDRSFTTLFVPGNHENYDRLSTYKVTEKWGGKVQLISNSIVLLMTGQVYAIDGLKVFTMGGARSTDRGIILGQEQAEKDIHKHWWEEEMPSHAERIEALQNLAIHNFDVDIVITHEAPSCVYSALGMDMLPEDIDDLPGFFQDLIDGTEDHPALNFKLWLCGHLHRDVRIGNIRVIYKDIIDIHEEMMSNHLFDKEVEDNGVY